MKLLLLITTFLSLALPQLAYATNIPTPGRDPGPSSNAPCGSSYVVPGRITQPGFPGYSQTSTCTPAPVSAVANSIVNRVLSIVFPLLTVLATIYLVYASILYITSRGNPEVTKKARTVIGHAVLGLVLVLTSYIVLGSILGFVRFLNRLVP